MREDAHIQESDRPPFYGLDDMEDYLDSVEAERDRLRDALEEIVTLASEDFRLADRRRRDIWRIARRVLNF